MTEVLSTIGGFIGLLTPIFGVLAYFKWKPKHPVEVKEAEVKIQSAQIKNENEIIAQYRAEFERLKERLDQAEKMISTLKEEAETERIDRSKQEAECQQNIAAMRREIQEWKEKESDIRKEMEIIKKKCKNKCFAK